MNYRAFFFIPILTGLVLFFAGHAGAAPPSLTYQGRILKADGSALEVSNVSFLFQITDPAGGCVLYEEQVSGYDMTNSGGVFDTPIGMGSRSFPASGSFTVLDSLSNAGALSCYGGATYTPSLDDGRKLRVQFYDGTGWKVVTPDNVIRSVPYAGYAASASKLGNNLPADFVLKTGLPTCSAGTFLSWDGTTLSCAPVVGSSGGTVTNVTSSNSYLTVATGSTTPALTLNVGTTANTVAAGNDSRIVSAILQSQFPASCTASQTLTFVSPAGSFTCSSIAITGAQVSGNIAGNAAGFTGSLAGDVSGTQGATSVDKIKGTPVSTVGLSTGKVLQFDGTNWAPATVAAGGAGTVTSVSSANNYLSVANGTNAAALTLNVGTVANTVAAGDDSRIVNAIQNAGGAVSIQAGLDASKGAASVAGRIYIATDTQKIYRDNGSSLVVVASVDAAGGGGSVSDVSSANADISVATSTTTPVLTLNSGTGANQILKLDGSSKIPAVDGSQVTNLNPASLSTVVPVNKGGTGQSSYTDGQILVGNSTGNTLSKQVLSGDAAMTNAGVVTVNGVKGKTVSAAPTASGQVLRYDGTNWTPNFISMFDLRSTVTGSATFGSGSAGCTAGQTLTWTAATDNLACTTIAISGSQVTYASQSANVVFAGPTTGSAAPSFRALVASDIPAGIASQWTTTGSDIYYNTGKVGIGTASPGATLDISSTMGVPVFIKSDNTWETAVQISNTSSGANRDWSLLATGSTNSAGSGKFQIYDNFAATTRLTIDTSGNFGIGTNAPTTNLHIQGDGSGNQGVVISDSGTPKLELRSTSSTADPYIDFTFGSTSNSGAGTPDFSHRIQADGATGSLFIGPAYKGSKDLVIASDGKVGIGTTSPLTNLHVYGPSGSTMLVVQAAGADGNSAELILGGGSGNANWSVLTNKTSVGGADDSLAFYKRSGSVGAKLVIQDNGNVGIGNTNPDAALTVNSDNNSYTIMNLYGYNGGKNAYVNIYNNSSSNPGNSGFALASNAGANYVVYNFPNDQFQFITHAGNTPLVIQNGGNVGIGTTAPGEKLEVSGNVKAAAYLVSSDIRLKHDVKALREAVETIMRLRGVHFRWNDTGREDIGFIAQEIERVLPELVHTDPVSGLKSVQYANVVAVLVAAVQEQQKRLDEHEERLRALERRLGR